MLWHTKGAPIALLSASSAVRYELASEATDGRAAFARLQAIDFGMAAKVGSPEFQGLAGTYRYMAPEIVNDRSYDEKVDLWSVGAIMYCILAGACVTAVVTAVVTHSMR